MQFIHEEVVSVIRWLILFSPNPVRVAVTQTLPVFPTCTLCSELLKTKLGKKCPRIIRVYSEMLENQMFPIPRDSLQVGGRGRRYELVDKDEQRDICLHRVIRKPSKKFSKKINEFDNLFKANKDTPENVTDQQVCFIFVLNTKCSEYVLKVSTIYSKFSNYLLLMN